MHSYEKITLGENDTCNCTNRYKGMSMVPLSAF